MVWAGIEVVGVRGAAIGHASELRALIAADCTAALAIDLCLAGRGVASIVGIASGKGVCRNAVAGVVGAAATFGGPAIQIGGVTVEA